MFDEQQFFDAPFPPFEPIQEQEMEEPKPIAPKLEDREGVFDQVENQAYGFLRLLEYNFQPSDDDVYVSALDVKRYRLRTGDYVKCQVDTTTKGRYVGCVKVYSINYKDPSLARTRVPFERLIPIFPMDKFKLVDDKPGEPLSNRLIDLFTPIGKGQRGMIVAQPKTGKTTLLKSIANAIMKHQSDIHMIILLIDERPEEVTDMKRSVENAMVISSTFDESAEHHIKVAKMVYEHARRMVESGNDVVILMDSITRLARAYNTEEPSSGKVLSGGVDPKALHKPKQFFGAARNIEDGGSLTILATALIETGSKMDDFIFEEFKGTGNMELQLNRAVANRRMFPAMDLVASSTRKDDLLMDAFTCNRMWGLRRMLSSMPIPDATELVINNMDVFKTNQEFLDNMNKNGYSK
ncbi:MAG: transcription termination factor Rho [bacterium]|nr:transcription termination factor Rho [Candidatus Colousia faecequi]